VTAGLHAWEDGVVVGTVGTETPGGGLPAGTVTLLLGDIEDSTRLWERRPDEMPSAVAALDALVSDTVATHDGVRPVEQGEGDSFVAAFTRASDAVACALALQQVTLAAGPLRLRMGIHTGEVQLRDAGNYMGRTVNRAARLRDTGHGGQVLLSQNAAGLARDQLPEGGALIDLGPVPLASFDEPERAFQLAHPDLPGRFPPLRTLERRRTNLPAQLTSFVGRAADTADVNGLLDEARLVTLTGAGGAGKTRLAIHVGEGRVDSHRDGVWFADLGRFNETEAALAGIAAAVGLARTTGLSFEVLARYIGDSDRLVVLDNCEHLIAFAASIADSLLRACPKLTILATSREPLGVAGEVTFRVPSLAAPTHDGLAVDEVAAYEAVVLFLERARRAKPDFALDDSNAATVVDICRRLEGLPLAIELAAARLRALTPQQILDGLHNRFRLLTGGARTTIARQQTLQASVDWSYGLLLDVERTVLNRLSVFAGGFTLAGAEGVCAGGPVEAHHVLDIVLHLVDKSLVNADGNRFHLLETVRQYAAGRLADAGEAEGTRARHYDYFYTAIRLRPALGDTEDGYRAAVEADYENIRRALQWAAEQPDPTLLARLCSRLAFYWLTGKREVDGVRWFEHVAADEVDAARKGLALVRLGTLLTRTGQFDRDVTVVEEGFTLLRSVDDRATLATALVSSVPTAERMEELEALAAELDSSELKAMAAYWRAWRTMMFGDPAKAASLATEAVELARREGLPWFELSAESVVAIAPVLGGEVAAALEGIEAATEAARRSREGFLLHALLTNQAVLRELMGDHLASQRALAELEALGEEAGHPLSFVTQDAKVWVAVLRTEWDEARHHLSARLDSPARPGVRSALLRLLATVDALAGEHADAARSLGDAARLPLDDSFTFVMDVSAALAAALSARAEGAWAQAEEQAQAALSAPLYEGQPVRLLTLLLLAGTWVGRGRHEEAVRLLAAARRETDRTGMVWDLPLFVAVRADAVESCRAALGPEQFDDLWAEGAAMSWDEAVAYAQRGWGARQRPEFGWDALTPTERQVADLVAAGASNKDVANKLFMSVATVKTHLTRIYGKVGVSSRGQLSAEAVRGRHV